MKWVEGLEKVSKIILIALVLLVITLNIKSFNKSQHRIAANDQIDFYQNQLVLSPEIEITLKIDDEKKYPLLELLINGVVVKKFGTDNEIKVNVKDRDLLEINGSMYQNRIRVVIDKIPKNVKIPFEESSAITEGNIQVLSTIRLQSLE